MTWLADTLFVTGALITAVLVLRRPVARWFGPGLAYALWLLPLLRLVLPPLTLPAPAVPSQGAVLVAVPAAGAAPITEVEMAVDWGGIAILVWLTGVFAFLVWRAWGYRAMRRLLLADARSVGETEGVRLIETPATAAPVAFGVLDKVIALPPGFMNQCDRSRRDLAIAHELEHHRGRDLLANMAVQPLFALHWFNPLAWLGWHALRRDQEAACDARVLAGTAAAARADYGLLIASFAHSPKNAMGLALAAPMACPVLGEKSIIHRLRSLTMNEPTPRARLAGRLLIGAAALALPLTATITYAASDAADAPAPVKTVKDVRKVKKIVIVDREGGGDPSDPKLHTKVIERGDKTIVLKTSKQLSDAEAEERIAKAEASMAEAEVAAEIDAEDFADFADSEDAVTGDPSRAIVFRGKRTADGEPGEHRQVMVFKGMPQAMAFAGDPEKLAAMACSDAQSSEVSADETKDGKRSVVKFRFCNKGGSTAHALDALKKARDRLSASRNLSDEIRGKVVDELNAEIEKLSKSG